MAAIISDIHGNLEALEAVLAHIQTRGIEEVICLGDVVGYGPDPDKCLDIVMERASFCLKGNHDWAVFHDAAGFNPMAQQAIDCVRKMLKPSYLNIFEKRARWNFLRDLIESKTRGRVLFVHASPRDPLFEYILEIDVFQKNYKKLNDIFELIPHICFVGHTHYPGIIVQEHNTYRFIRPTGESARFSIQKEKMIINDGSVGQPRDRDNRACYVEFDGQTAIFHRIPYDFRKTMKKIESNPCLDDFLGRRLAVGM